MGEKKQLKKKLADSRYAHRCTTAELIETRRDLEAVRTRLVRERADTEELRDAGRCLYRAIEPPQVNPLTTSVDQMQAIVADKMAGLEHAREHWLSVDPL